MAAIPGAGVQPIDLPMPPNFARLSRRDVLRDQLSVYLFLPQFVRPSGLGYVQVRNENNLAVIIGVQRIGWPDQQFNANPAQDTWVQVPPGTPHPVPYNSAYMQQAVNRAAFAAFRSLGVDPATLPNPLQNLTG